MRNAFKLGLASTSNAKPEAAKRGWSWGKNLRPLDEELVNAAATNRLKEAQSLLEKGADINACAHNSVLIDVVANSATDVGYWMVTRSKCLACTSMFRTHSPGAKMMPMERTSITG